MGKLQKIQTDFTYGEVSPKIHGRVDLDAYAKATKTILNAYPFAQGGITRRKGTLFVGEVYNSAQKAKLIPFVHSNANRYVLVLNGGKIEFIKNGAFIMNGAAHYALNIPYTEADLPLLRYTQFGNVMFFTHPSYPPKKMERVSDTNWLLTDIAFTQNAVADYWFHNFAINFKLIDGSGSSVNSKFIVGDYYTVVTNGAGGITAVNAYLQAQTIPCNGQITQVSATANAPAETWTIYCTFATSSRTEFSVSGSVSGSPNATWRTGVYPSAIGFHEQRLFFAGSTDNPQTIWGSASGSYYNFTLGPKDDDAVSFTVPPNNFDQIIHLVSARQLLPLSPATEFSMSGTVGGITPSAIKIRPETYHGIADVRPIRIGSEIIFIQRDGQTARAISYSAMTDANVAPEVTLFADHITKPSISDMTFAQSPHYLAWMVRSDGVLVSLTLARQYETVAFARHTTDGLFEAVTSLNMGTSDEVYVAVKRTINGVQKRYIERFDYTNSTYSDCSLIGTNGTAQTVWTGLSHLEGKTLDVVADGVVCPSVVVTGGQITLATAAFNIIVGLHYETKIELLNPEMGNASDSSQARKISVHNIMLRLHETVNCKVGGVVQPFRKNTDGLDKVIPPFTGDIYVNNLGWRSPNNIVIEQVTPMPFTLLAVVLKVEVNE